MLIVCKIGSQMYDHNLFIFRMKEWGGQTNEYTRILISYNVTTQPHDYSQLVK